MCRDLQVLLNSDKYHLIGIARTNDVDFEIFNLPFVTCLCIISFQNSRFYLVQKVKNP